MRTRIIKTLDKIILWLIVKRNIVAYPITGERLEREEFEKAIELEAGKEEVGKLFEQYKNREHKPGFMAIDQFANPSLITQLPKKI